MIAFIKQKMLSELFNTRKQRLTGMNEITLSLTSKRVFLVSELSQVFLEVKYTLLNHV